nr:hypothetical protein [Tanacetum cinerariifolium]
MAKEDEEKTTFITSQEIFCYSKIPYGLKMLEQPINVRTNRSENLQANVDPKLVSNQVNETYGAKEPGMIKYLEKLRSPKQVVLVEELKEKPIDENDVLAIVEEEGHTWMTSIYENLTEEILSEEKRKARAIRRKAGRYAVTNGILYKRSFLGPWLRCVGLLQENYVLREIHERSCSKHAGSRSGYYWPTMHADAKKLIRECKSWQVHRPMPRNPQEKLTPITSLWPFYK